MTCGECVAVVRLRRRLRAIERLLPAVCHKIAERRVHNALLRALSGPDSLERYIPNTRGEWGILSEDAAAELTRKLRAAVQYIYATPLKHASALSSWLREYCSRISEEDCFALH